MLFSQYLRRINLKRDEIPSFNKYPFNLPSLKTLDKLSIFIRMLPSLSVRTAWVNPPC